MLGPGHIGCPLSYLQFHRTTKALVADILILSVLLITYLESMFFLDTGKKNRNFNIHIFFFYCADFLLDLLLSNIGMTFFLH